MASFAQLSDGLVERLLQYFTLKERTRFERINRHFAHLLEKKWMKQMAIDLRPYSQRVMCLHSDHRIEEKDVCDLDKINSIYPKEQILLKLLTRCLNLKAIHFNQSSVTVVPNFGVKLAHMCPRIEHFASKAYGPTKHVLTKYIDNVKEVMITCIDMWVEEYEIVEIFKLCPRLDRLPLLNLPINLNPDTVQQLNRSISGLRELAIYQNSHSLELVREPNLTKLRFPSSILPQSQVEVICKCLPKLKSIEFRSCSINMQFLRLLNHLEEVHWSDECCYYTKALDEEGVKCNQKKEAILSYSFAQFLERNGKALRSLILKINVSPRESFQSLATFCPHLETLRVDYNFEINQGLNRFLSDVSSLRTLRCLTLDNGIVTEDGLNSLLDGCYKLRDVRFCFCDILVAQKQLYTNFAHYAGLHPKRRVVLTLRFKEDLLKEQEAEMVSYLSLNPISNFTLNIY